MQRFVEAVAVGDLGDDFRVEAAPAAPDTGAMLDQLRQLGELRAAGVLTEAEFEAQKARILAS